MHRQPAPILELEDVRWTQGGVEILRNVSWSLRPGERWAILGRNGSGKSSLLKVACGLNWPTSGIVRRFGRELMDLSILKRSVGWVTSELVRAIPPQEPAIETVVSGPLGQIGLKRYGHSQPGAEMFDIARIQLESLSCGHLADRPFGVLSQGEKQQVLVARARNTDPIAIICDEPCAGMDPAVRERFLAWIESIAATDDSTAWVLVTHHVEEIMPAFTQTMMICAGSIVASGETSQVVEAAKIESLYQTPLTRLIRENGRSWPIWRGVD